MKKGMEIVPVSTVDEVLAHALVSAPQPVDWDEGDEVEPVATESAENEAESVIRH